MMRHKPCVFAAGREYQIKAEVTGHSIMWVEVGDSVFRDEICGVMRSETKVHTMRVPMEVLDKAGKYTICEKEIIGDRKSYYTELGETVKEQFDFYPVKGENPRAYHISDTHDMITEPISAAKNYGKFDFLIFNGDIAGSSYSLDAFDEIYEISEALTGGSIPVVCVRGNHDLRGAAAEFLPEYMPTYNGMFYYTVKLGSVWILVLDCGEDKDDSHIEYGGTVCCHEYRLAETKFIKSVIENSENEYNDATVKTRLVIVHNPFPEKFPDVFEIEDDIYREWCTLLRNEVKPDVMICGHQHKLYISHPGDAMDFRGAPCPIVLASEIRWEEKLFAGCGFEFRDDMIVGRFTYSDGKGTDFSEKKSKR